MLPNNFVAIRVRPRYSIFQLKSGQGKAIFQILDGFAWNNSGCRTPRAHPEPLECVAGLGDWMQTIAGYFKRFR